MPVYCDVCTQHGSPTDDAGYRTNGGWLCLAHRQIEFTPEEKRALAEAMTKAAVGIAQCCDVLLKIRARIGRDWEPVDCPSRKSRRRSILGR